MTNLTLAKLQVDFSLRCLQGECKDDKIIIHHEVLVPSIEFAGHFDRIQGHELVLLGKKECSFFATKSQEEQVVFYQQLFKEGMPCVILCDRAEVTPALQQVCQQYKITILQSDASMKELYIRLNAYLVSLFAPEVLFHGTLLEIYGQGVILVGKSGIGKSEVALELIKKGHRLVADDAILINQIGQEIHGRAPEHLKYFLEVRGIGLIDVYKMFGINSIADHKTIRYIVELDHLEANQGIKRLPETQSYRKILQVTVPSATILVGGGRNIADLVEVAVTNLRLKAKGYDPEKELIAKHQRLLEGGNDDD